ncbi:molecular chaperone DnaJ [Candidatus Poribacteria bacterium]|nr:molecular chaperone DnaJ [Candidatus Poribacteria bacterium]
MAKRDPYEVLGVGKNANDKDIKQAYYRLAKEHHPDKNPDKREESTEKFKEIQEAYDVLKDPNRRARYDQFGWDGLEGTGFNQGAGFGFGSFEDIVEEIFGGGSIFDDFFGTRTRRRSGPRPGSDLRKDIEITLEEAVKGKEMSIEVPTLRVCHTCQGSGSKDGSTPQTCLQCGGRGQVQQQSGFFITSRTCPICKGEGVVITDPCESCNGDGRIPHTSKLSINIPPGASNGLVLRYPGAGEAGIKGGNPGDLHIVIHVAEHPIFERQGDDLICKVNVAFTQAALGAAIEVPIIGGKAKLNIPSGTQNGKVFSMKDRGVPHLRGRGSGDQYVKVNVDIPTKLSSKEENLIRELAKLRDEKVASPEKGFLNKVKDALS